MTDKLARLVFTGRVRERCWKKTGRMLATTRMPVEQCFAVLEERARQDHAPYAFIYRDIRARLNAGFSLGRAIAPFCTPEEVMLIESGALAGASAGSGGSGGYGGYAGSGGYGGSGASHGLASAFARAARLLEKRRLLTGCIAKELSYPLALMLAVCAFLCAISIVLVPRLADLSTPQAWKGAAGTLYAVSCFIASWKGAALGLFLVLGAGISLWSMPRWTGRIRSLADHVPPWSVYRLMTGTSWLYATAMLLSQREVRLSEATAFILEHGKPTPYLASHLGPVAEADSKGCTLGEALCQTRDRWPDRQLASDLAIYSALPDFRSMLANLAEDMLQEGMEKIQATARVTGSLALLFITLSICLVVAGLYGIQEEITSAVGAMGGI